ncbi:MAG: hypothetical protein JSV86_15380 [Gemmatimonadota bacterium]|nr:MAG: hypothetical protein JSV86_15380 [Gemmatimonadota bacterium]
MARRTGKGEPRKPRKPVAEPEEVLRAKYLDYCSARLCDVFMELEEERVFELARAAEERAGVSQGALSFQEIADLLVEQLMDDLALPNFTTWGEAYQEHPEDYDPYLLGLWKTMVESPATR